MAPEPSEERVKAGEDGLTTKENIIFALFFGRNEYALYIMVEWARSYGKYLFGCTVVTVIPDSKSVRIMKRYVVAAWMLKSFL